MSKRCGRLLSMDARWYGSDGAWHSRDASEVCELPTGHDGDHAWPSFRRRFLEDLPHEVPVEVRSSSS